MATLSEGKEESLVARQPLPTDEQGEGMNRSEQSHEQLQDLEVASPLETTIEKPSPPVSDQE